VAPQEPSKIQGRDASPQAFLFCGVAAAIQKTSQAPELVLSIRLDAKGLEEFRVDGSRDGEAVLLLVGFDGATAGGDLAVDRAVVEADLLERDLHGGLDWVGGVDGVVQIHGLCNHRPSEPRTEGDEIGDKWIAVHLNIAAILIDVSSAIAIGADDIRVVILSVRGVDIHIRHAIAVGMNAHIGRAFVVLHLEVIAALALEVHIFSIVIIEAWLLHTKAISKSTPAKTFAKASPAASGVQLAGGSCENQGDQEGFHSGKIHAAAGVPTL